MPPVHRALPLAEQLRNHYAEGIADGTYPPDTRLPSATEMAGLHGVSRALAGQVIAWLKAGRLVRTDRDGTWVLPGPPRLVLGPQQRLAAARTAPGERVEVRAAGLTVPPDYVLPLLGLDAGGQVIRREQVTYGADGVPFMLSVSWYSSRLATAIPELLEPVPASHPGGWARLIEERTGVTIVRGKESHEARQIFDDGREGPLLGLPLGTTCLAQVYRWIAAGPGGGDPGTIEYTEFVLPPGRVVETEFAVAARPEVALPGCPSSRFLVA